MATIKDLLSAMIEKIHLAPKTVNGIAPDENGNVEVVGGVTSWNDLTDKPFGDEVERVQILDTNKAWATEQLIAGNEYVVVYEGEEYRQTAYACTYNDNSGVAVGNAAIVYMGADTGEPFFIQVDSYMIDGEYATHFYTSDNQHHQVFVYREETTISPLPTKYLPEHLQFGEEHNEITLVNVESDYLEWTMVGDNSSELEMSIPTENFVELEEGMISQVEFALGLPEIASIFKGEVVADNYGSLKFSAPAYPSITFTLTSSDDGEYRLSAFRDGLYDSEPYSLTVTLIEDKITPLDPKYLPFTNAEEAKF